MTEIEFERGVTLYKQRRVDEARVCFDSVLAADPDHVKGRFALAVTCFDQQDHAAAEQHLTEVVHRHPGHARARLYLGRLHELRGSVHEAAAFYREALAIDPNTKEAQVRLDGLGHPASTAPAAAPATRRQPRFLHGALVVGVIAEVETPRTEYGGAFGADHAGAMQRAPRSGLVFRLRPGGGGALIAVQMRGTNVDGSYPKQGDWVAVPHQEVNGRLVVDRYENLTTGELVVMRQPSKAGDLGTKFVGVFACVFIALAFAWLIYGFVTTQL